MALSGVLKRQNLQLTILVTVFSISVTLTDHALVLRSCFLRSPFKGQARRNWCTNAEGFCPYTQGSAPETVRGTELFSATCQSVDKKTSSLEEMDGRSLEEKEEEYENDTNLYSDVNHENWKVNSSEFLAFPLDPVAQNYVRRNVPNAVFSVVDPTPMKGETKLVGVSSSALSLIDLLPSVATSSFFRDFASGAWRHPSSTPLAHRYGGHQFGWWAMQLGDGRAHLLGHYTNRNGEWWEVQLKGSGKTPYSRDGDGRAVVRSSVREFLAAEAMDALGFHTSRCASLVIGEELALRDQFYTGNLKMERTAVVLRLAPTWFRFGSIEILSKKNEIESLRFLIDHIISKHFKTVLVTDPDKYLHMFSVVVEETAEMIAQWQSIGFTHGVMNTDNMSIVSVTIDYGPFGFMDTYNPNFIPNSSDDGGMYSYKNQPRVGYDNLQRLGNALQHLLTPNQALQIKTILDGYDHRFLVAYLTLFSKKLGLKNFREEDKQLVEILLDVMRVNKADFTMTFWELGNITLTELEAKKVPKDFWALNKIIKDDRFAQLLEMYKKRLKDEESTDDSRREIMATANPKYVLRNWIAQQAIKKVEQENFDALDQLLRILRNPFQTQHEAESKGYASIPPAWSKSLKVSCSS